MWHIFIMERIDQMENKQKPVERETRQLIQTYNVLLKSQIYAYFAKTQRDHFVGRAFKTLEKEKQIYIHQDLEMAAINEEAFKARNVGTLQAFWVLLDIMEKPNESFYVSYEFQHRVNSRKETLSSLEKRILDLRALGYTYQQIADTLHIKAKKVDNTLQKIRKDKEGAEKE